MKPARIVFEHVSGPTFQATATFAEDDGGIKLTFRMLFDTTAECEQIMKYAVEANEQNFGRLAAHLVKVNSTQQV